MNKIQRIRLPDGVWVPAGEWTITRIAFTSCFSDWGELTERLLLLREDAAGHVIVAAHVIGSGDGACQFRVSNKVMFDGPVRFFRAPLSLNSNPILIGRGTEEFPAGDSFEVQLPPETELVCDILFSRPIT